MTSGDGQRLDSLLDIEFDQLALDGRTFDTLGLSRPPRWHELHRAIREAIDALAVAELHLAGLTQPETGGGRCLLFAGVTGGVLDVLTKEKVGAAAGTIVMASRSDPSICYAMPRNLNPPSLDGGYHAWNVLDTERGFFFVDMSYHWIARANPDIVGPTNFLVARATTLDSQGISYNAHEGFMHLVAPALTPLNLIPLVKEALTRLHRVVQTPAPPG